MKSQLLQDHVEKTYVVVFDKGEEVVAGLLDFARRNRLSGSHLVAIGALQDVVLGYFDRERKEYGRIPVQEQVEVLSLIGNLAVQEGEHKLHAHLVIGKRDGTAHGGHLLEAHVWPTLEVVIEEQPEHLARRIDPETSLALLSSQSVP